MACRSIWSNDTPTNSTSFRSLECFNTKPALKYNCPFQESPVEYFRQIPFHSELQKALDNSGYASMNDLQKGCFPLFLTESNYSGIVCAPTGSGKTMTIALLALEEASRIKVKKYPQIVILCKTLELAKRMHERAAELSKYSNITIRLVARGKEIKKNGAISQDVIIGTPENVYEIAVGSGIDLQKIHTLIVDDADYMVPNKGHNNIMSQIRCQLSKSCRIILFSCTKTEEIRDFIEKHNKCYTEVSVSAIKRPMRQIFLVCSNLKERMKAAAFFATTYKYPGQSVVVCNKKEIASLVIESCEELPFILLDGNMKKNQRAGIIDSFNKGCIETLVTTPVFLKILAKDNISLIFNFDQLLKDNKLNYESYEERASMIGMKCQGIVINVIEKEWARFVLPQGTRDNFGNEIKSYQELVEVNLN